jgi:hypothetical protein
MRVRVNNDGGLQSPGLNTDPHCGSFFFDSGTAFALTTPTTATAITGTNATGLAIGPSFGALQTLAAGSFTVTRAGLYRVTFGLSQITAVNSQVITLEVYKNGAVIPSTTGNGPVKALFTQPGTAVEIPAMGTEGLVQLTVGDVVTLTAIASTGNFGAKRLQFVLVQLADVAVSPVL